MTCHYEVTLVRFLRWSSFDRCVRPHKVWRKPVHLAACGGAVQTGDGLSADSGAQPLTNPGAPVNGPPLSESDADDLLPVYDALQARQGASHSSHAETSRAVYPNSLGDVGPNNPRSPRHSHRLL